MQLARLRRKRKRNFAFEIALGSILLLFLLFLIYRRYALHHTQNLVNQDYLHGSYYLNKKNYALAKAYLQKIHTNNPNLARRAYYKLAYIYAQENNYQKAVEYFDRASVIPLANSSSVDTVYAVLSNINSGILYVYYNNYKQARERFNTGKNIILSTLQNLQKTNYKNSTSYVHYLYACLTTCYEGIGVVDLMNKRKSQALSDFRLALTYANKSGIKYLADRAKQDISLVKNTF